MFTIVNIDAAKTKGEVPRLDGRTPRRIRLLANSGGHGVPSAEMAIAEVLLARLVARAFVTATLDGIARESMQVEE